MRFVIVTGMSGAGKSTTLKTLEDIGYFCVDNLPIQLIMRFAEIAYAKDNDINNVAIGVDIRSGVYLEQLSECLQQLKESQYDYEILFLDSNDDVLIKRYKETRRNHDEAIQNFVMQFDEAKEFMNKIADLLEFLIPNYIKEGKNGLVVAIGCTGGKHRSVTLANGIYKELETLPYSVRIVHRDIEKDANRKG